MHYQGGNIMYTHINKKSILNFYKNLNFTKFLKITEERKEELDNIVAKNVTYFRNSTIGNLTLMTLLSERLTTSYKNYGLQNGDEKAYFFVKIIDPDLQHLAIYEAANKIEDVKEFSIKNFNYYDKYLITLEKHLNERFKEYETEELWSRENIKR